jgi:tetratricopeptide (TPR) repeat protein
VQLFAQQARRVKPSFEVTTENLADVAAICRRLDGLPLAIELAAARTRLLSPGAIVARLDNALDIAAIGSQGPSRQKTLRDTIAWSYDLLTPSQRTFFRRLGVFAGGAGLDAIRAVTASEHDAGAADPLDMVAELLDANLVTIGEDVDGEPRVGMLETIRSYALERLVDAGELDGTRQAHAHHFVRVADLWSGQLSSGGGLEHYVEVAARVEQDHDNMRAALSWALSSETSSLPPPDRAQLALTLCAALGDFWVDRGYYGEGRQWTERAVAAAGNHDSVELGRCLHNLSHLHKVQGHVDAAHSLILETAELWRRLGHEGRLAHALSLLSWLERSKGDLTAARRASEEVVALSRATGDRKRLAFGLWHLAGIEADEGNFERSVELLRSAISIHAADGDEFYLWDVQYSLACVLRRMGRGQEAYAQMRQALPHLLQLSGPETLVTTAEDYGALLADLGEFPHAVRLLGSAEAMRERIGAPRERIQEAEIAESFARTRVAMTADDWQREYLHGRNTIIEDAIEQALAATPGESS